ncbi:flagellar basal body rod protein FlgB [Acidovorax sp. HDW3]|uniref:flagellar basal body rod protein FlgB n=1 Tax=Acidovorax sp. HDW3 TaxID=2714923 RepID=UPI00140944AC|nr:flagellar basal body rod protein FlgB [Acidovorax sp. HDW3]QIL45104.1 flagellar basal body rod protein FlgB [Acidovorax sp. HDW3]
MLDKLTQPLAFQGNALQLRAERQRIIASNIANADTPGYVARDFQFADALRAATDDGNALAQKLGSNGATDPRHIPLPAARSGEPQPGALGYGLQTEPSMDKNTVDMDRERANFVDNSVRYEAALRFINGSAKTMLSAIQGQ